MTLDELEALKQERLANRSVWQEAAQANAKRAEACVKRFRSAGFEAMRRKCWELSAPNIEASQVEEAAEIYVEHKKLSLAEAERLVAELDAKEEAKI